MLETRVGDFNINKNFQVSSARGEKIRSFEIIKFSIKLLY